MLKPFLAALSLALLAGGCGLSNPPITPEQGEAVILTQVGELCRLYELARNKPPAKRADLGTVSSMAANGYAAVRSGQVILCYSAKLPSLSEDPGEGPGDEVLAYYARVPVAGGQVLMLNRTIKTMTPDEFKAAPKPAGAKISDAEPVKKN